MVYFQKFDYFFLVEQGPLIFTSITSFINFSKFPESKSKFCTRSIRNVQHFCNLIEIDSTGQGNLLRIRNSRNSSVAIAVNYCFIWSFGKLKRLIPNTRQGNIRGLGKPFRTHFKIISSFGIIGECPLQRIPVILHASLAPLVDCLQCTAQRFETPYCTKPLLVLIVVAYRNTGQVFFKKIGIQFCRIYFFHSIHLFIIPL